MPGPIAVGALVVVAAIAAACSSNAGTSPSAASAAPAGAPASASAAPGGSTGPSAAAREIDRQFIDMMVPHHQSAIEMAKLALDRAEHAELKELAGMIVSAQEAEIAQMREWRQAWFGSSGTPPMTEMPMLPGMGMPAMSPMPSGGMSMAPGHAMGDEQTMDMTAEIERLRSADLFDLAFIDAMIEHHRMAIEASQIALGSGANPDVRELAHKIIEDQQQEIDQLTGWRSDWYPGR